MSCKTAGCKNTPALKKGYCNHCRYVRSRHDCKLCGRNTARNGNICLPCHKAAEQAAIGDGNKRCRKCEEIKPKSEFYKDRHIKDGFATRCKPCAIGFTPRKKVLPDHHADIEYLGGSRSSVDYLRVAL